MASNANSNAGDHEKENVLGFVTSVVFVLSQMAVHKMNLTGDLQEMTELDALCEELKTILSAVDKYTVFDSALAAKSLSIVGINTAAVDSLRSFESDCILPLLLALDTSRRYSGNLDARCDCLQVDTTSSCR